MTVETAPPRFRPVAASTWMVAACTWGALAIVLGGVHLYDEWTQYQFLREIQSGSYGWAAYSVSRGTLLLVSLLSILWIAVSVVWLGAAVALRARRKVAAAGAVVAVAVVAGGVLRYANNHAHVSTSLEPQLLTPAFLAGVVFVLTGIAALVIARWPLHGD